MNIKISILLFFMVLTAKSLMAEQNIMFEKANQLYHNKMYDSAAKLYLHMIEDGYCSAELYYNAGNAFYKINNIGWSVWSYRKAQLLRNDKNVQDNLELAKRRIKEPIKIAEEIFFIQWWRSTYNMFTINQWASLALLFFLIGILIQSLRKLNFEVKLPLKFSKIILAASLIAFVLMMIRLYHNTYQYKGILIGNNIDFQSISTKEVETLSAGNEVQFLQFKNKDEMNIRLSNGREGIIKSIHFKQL